MNMVQMTGVGVTAAVLALASMCDVFRAAVCQTQAATPAGIRYDRAC